MIKVTIFVDFIESLPLVICSSDDRIRFELGAANFFGFFI
jgi:hypothetical protein